jgi:uncharacterized protein Yka (UPF0111/DUF47 family)
MRIPGGLGRPLFDLLAASARNLVAAAELLVDLYDRHPEVGDRPARIAAAEEEGDRITAEIYRRLDRNFASPLPRADLIALARALDTICDEIEQAAVELDLVGVRTVPELARAQARTVLGACERLLDAVERLHRLPDLTAEVADVYELEDEGDRIVRDALARLFASGGEPLEIIRLKIVHDRLEIAANAAKAAARVLERISVTSG